ncbi:MAG TPA: glycosyltransferase family 2 protein [Rhodoferax sp.]
MKTPNQTSTAIIIPAFNEAATIAAVVREASCIGQVIVVNDGSSDDTEKAAYAAGATVITLKGNQGYEGALTSGMQFAITKNFSFALTMDADGQHRLESAQQLLDSIQDSDLVIGIRQKKQRFTEVIAGWIGAHLWGINDPFSGLKLYRLESCKAIGNFDTRRLVGAEMFVRAHRKGLSLKAIPIQTNERTDAPRFDSTLRANFRIARAMVLLVAISWAILP